MNGVLNFYKEQGITSFKAVDMVRKLLGVKKCGHLGTLDPMAEGVLPICVGFATRFADYLSSCEKEYIAEFKLGVKTDSFDTTGSILQVNDDIKPSIEDVRQSLKYFKGEVSLIVPSFSAKKINGVRAYKLARAGEIEDAGEREMSIYSCDLLSYEYPFGIIKVSCGKGTYIRSIISSMGAALGSGAAMSGLIRSGNGEFRSSGAFKYDALKELVTKGEADKAVINVEELLRWPRASIKDSTLKAILNGASPERQDYLKLPIEEDGDDFFITNSKGDVIATAIRQQGAAIPLKVKMVLN